jgi:hypothetical protein
LKISLAGSCHGFAWPIISKRVEEADKLALEAKAILEKGNFPAPKTPMEKYYALCITGLGPTAEEDVKELFDDIPNWRVVASRAKEQS